MTACERQISLPRLPRKTLLLAAALVLMVSAWTGHAEDDTDREARRRFQEIASRLDLGGELFLVVDLTDRVKGLFESLLPEAPPRSAEARALQAAAGRVDRFLRDHGAYGLQGFGMSAVALGDGRHAVKCFIRRDYVESSLPAWRGTVGWLPRRMMAIDFLPADADYARASTADPMAAWNLVRNALTQAADADTGAAFEAWVESVSQRAGMPLEDILLTLRDEHFIAVRLREGQPEVLIGVSVRNEVLRGVLEAQLAAAGLTVAEMRVGDTPLRYATGPLPGPWPMQPALAAQSGFLLGGTSTNIVADAVRSFRHKSGLITRPAFRSQADGLPMVNNGLVYLGPRMGDAVAQRHAATLAERLEPRAKRPLLDGIRRELAGLEAGHSHTFVILNWRQGVMVMGNSSWGAGHLTRRLPAGPLHPVAPLLLPELGLFRALPSAE